MLDCGGLAIVTKNFGDVRALDGIVTSFSGSVSSAISSLLEAKYVGGDTVVEIPCSNSSEGWSAPLSESVTPAASLVTAAKKTGLATAWISLSRTIGTAEALAASKLSTYSISCS